VKNGRKKHVTQVPHNSPACSSTISGAHPMPPILSRPSTKVGSGGERGQQLQKRWRWACRVFVLGACLGHGGAWLEWTISEEITRCEITIKWLSEVVFCATSSYLSPCTRVYVQGPTPSGRIFQIPTVWSNMITQIPKLYLWYLSDVSWWLFHVGMQYGMWCVLPRMGSAFCCRLWWCGERSKWLSVTAYISEELF